MRNVITLYKAGKLTPVIMEMHRIGIEILGLNEVRWPNSGPWGIHDDVVPSYSAFQNGESKQGLGIIINKEL